MDIRWIENVRREFCRIYGQKRGTAVCNAVIPGVMGDFRGMVLAAAEGQAVRQTYRVDDKRAAVTMTGRHEHGACAVTGIEVNGASVDLGAGKLLL